MSTAARRRVFPKRLIEVESISTKGAGIAPADPATRSVTIMAINAQTIHDEWNFLCGLARKGWSQLTEDDLRVAEGNI